MQVLNAAHPFVSILTLLICTAILVVAFRILRIAYETMTKAEHRIKYLREEQARLEAEREERHTVTEVLGTVQEQQLKADRERESIAEDLRNIEKMLKGRGGSQKPETKRDTNGTSTESGHSDVRKRAGWQR